MVKEQKAEHSIKLKEWRKYRGITQERLAKLVGVTVQTIRAWESGRSFPVKGDNLEKRNLTKLTTGHNILDQAEELILAMA